MRYSIKTTERFIPTCGGNDKADDPVVFVIRFPTTREREDLKEWQSSVDLLDVDGAGKAPPKMRYIVKHVKHRALKMCVDSIEGLEVEIDGMLKRIEKADDFIGLPFFDDMADEVADHIVNSKGREVKNS